MVPHVPLVDVDGVDALVPVATGVVLKLQVKTVTASSSPRLVSDRLGSGGPAPLLRLPRDAGRRAR